MTLCAGRLANKKIKRGCGEIISATGILPDGYILSYGDNYSGRSGFVWYIPERSHW
jgi:hypothetical protein